jgi:hypothetical protein
VANQTFDSRLQVVPPLLLQVKGKQGGDQYTVYPRHYCSCQAFFYEAVCKSEALCVSVVDHRRRRKRVHAGKPPSAELTREIWHTSLPLSIVPHAVQAPAGSSSGVSAEELPHPEDL